MSCVDASRTLFTDPSLNLSESELGSYLNFLREESDDLEIPPLDSESDSELELESDLLFASSISIFYY